MTDSKSTKRALAASIGCIALCVVMLIGTTFAWFTDTASTGVNQIQSGTLSVALEMQDSSGVWVSAENQPLDFKKADAAGTETVLWEPGCTYELPTLRVKNTGTLALKYKIQVTGIQGDSDLNNAIEWTVTEGGTTTSLGTDCKLEANATSGNLTIKAHMKDNAGNEYQGKKMTGVKISVLATQDTVEYDSYSNEYDWDAEYATPASDLTELNAALANGENVVLDGNANIDVPNTVSGVDTFALEIKQDTTIYGNGTAVLKASDSVGSDGRVINVNDNTTPVTLTLSGVNVVGPTTNNTNRGISVYGNTDASIVMDNCTVTADHYPLNIARENKKVNVSVRNSTLTGYCAFQTASPNTTATFENCTLTGENNYKGRTDNFAAIVINAEAQKANLTFKNCRIVATENFTPIERLLRADSGSSGTVTFEGCSFVHNGVELTTQDEINEYIGISKGSSVEVLFK